MIKDKIIHINSDNVIIKTRKNKGYIYNKENFKYMILTKQVIDYIQQADQHNMTMSELIDLFDKEDKIYIEQTLDILNEMGLFDFSENKLKNIKKVNISLTNKCNLECKHCCNQSSPREKTNLQLDDWKLVIDKLSQFNLMEIVFSGGEPLILPFFEELIVYAKNKMPMTKFNLLTNATLIDHYDVKFFKNNFNIIDISIDGHDKESTDKIRGYGVFDKVIKNVRLLKNNEFHNINLSFTQNDFNRGDTKYFYELCNQLKVSSSVRCFSPVGRGHDNVNLFTLENKLIPSSRIEFIKKAYFESNKNDISISTLACNSGIDQIYINDKGDVYPCPSLDNDKFKITNIQDDQSIKEIQEFNGGYRVYEHIISNSKKCKDCDVNIFCWSCPADFNTVYSNDNIDYWCDNMKKYLNKLIWNEG